MIFEIKTLKSILTFSAVTSTEAMDAQNNLDWDKRYANRSLAQQIITDMNEKYKEYFAEIGNSLTLYQANGS